MKIPLYFKGQMYKYALIDKEDFELVNKHKWFYRIEASDKEYARKRYRENGKIREVIMHRYIIKARRGKEVDHINGNGLDNRKVNLRICSHKSNSRNRKLNKNNKTGYKGVYRKNGKYRATITFNYKSHDLGAFDDLISAAKVYNKAAKKYFGKYASVNST